METKGSKVSPTKSPKKSTDTQSTAVNSKEDDGPEQDKDCTDEMKTSGCGNGDIGGESYPNGVIPKKSPVRSVTSAAWNNEKETKKAIATCITEDQPDITVINEIKILKKNHIKEKMTFVISVASVVVMSYGVLYEHWLLPYYYAVSTPLLMLFRFIMYFKDSWLNFMLDFCYFANTLCYIYIWAIPSQPELFMIFFAFANGPLPWAVIIFRNSVVFHSIDKMTSIYIHVLPLFLTFSIRWYASSISQHWYTAFLSTFNEDIGYMFIWLIGVPLSLFMVHTMTLFVLLQLVCRPKEKYIDSFRYLTHSEKGWTGKLMNCLGPKHKGCMFNSMTILYGIASHMLLPLWYKYFPAHCAYMVLVLLITVWNGAAYYIEVFGPREIKL